MWGNGVGKRCGETSRAGDRRGELRRRLIAASVPRFTLTPHPLPHRRVKEGRGYGDPLYITVPPRVRAGQLATVLVNAKVWGSVDVQPPVWAWIRRGTSYRPCEGHRLPSEQQKSGRQPGFSWGGVGGGGPARLQRCEDMRCRFTLSSPPPRLLAEEREPVVLLYPLACSLPRLFTPTHLAEERQPVVVGVGGGRAALCGGVQR